MPNLWVALRLRFVLDSYKSQIAHSADSHIARASSLHEVGNHLGTRFRT